MPSLRIGRDVGRHEGAERRLQFEPAGQFEPRRAFRFRACMAGGAAAGPEDALAARRHRPCQALRRLAASSRCGAVRNQNAAAPMPPSTSAATSELSPIGPCESSAFLMRKVSWQPPQFAPMAPSVAPSAATSCGGAATAAAVSALNLSTLAWKPAMSSQIFGEQSVSPVSLPAGNRAATSIFCASSLQRRAARQHRGGVERLLALGDRHEFAHRLAVAPSSGPCGRRSDRHRRPMRRTRELRWQV